MSNPNWKALLNSEDFQGMFSSAPLAAMVTAKERELTQGREVDPHELGWLRGWLDAVRFLQGLPARQLDIEERQRKGITR